MSKESGVALSATDARPSEPLNKVTVFLTTTQLNSLDNAVAREKGEARKSRDAGAVDVDVNVNRSWVLRKLINECLAE
jgi:hypothetical protein